jgi:hypothetical protein
MEINMLTFDPDVILLQGCSDLGQLVVAGNRIRCSEVQQWLKQIFINPKTIPMKNLHLFFTLPLLLIPSLLLNAQESTAKKSALYPTIGIGIGFFYPKDVNDYIDYDLSEYITVNEDMYMYLEVKGGLTYRIKKADFSGMLEFDVGPKFVTTGDEVISYFYTRVAPEISANYYISGKSGKNAFFIGGAISYGFMKFEDYSASAPGFKGQLGYSMQFGKFNMQPYLAFRYTKATDTINGFDVDLDYTGGQIGLIFSFHPRILYK